MTFHQPTAEFLQQQRFISNKKIKQKLLRSRRLERFSFYAADFISPKIHSHFFLGHKTLRTRKILIAPLRDIERSCRRRQRHRARIIERQKLNKKKSERFNYANCERDEILSCRPVVQWVVDEDICMFNVNSSWFEGDFYPQLACAFAIFDSFNFDRRWDTQMNIQQPKKKQQIFAYEHRIPAAGYRKLERVRASPDSLIVAFMHSAVLVFLHWRAFASSSDKRLWLQIEYNKGRAVDKEIKLTTQKKIFFLFSPFFCSLLCCWCSVFRKQNII